MILDSRYLVSLDAIFDTRLGTLALLDQDTALSVMRDKKYVYRTKDDFMEGLGNVSADAYHRKYKTRNKFTLAASTPTHIFEWLKMMISEDMRDPNFQYHGRKAEIMVNTWPYSLDEYEKKQLEEIIWGHLPFVDGVKIWTMSPQQLSPDNLKNNCITNYIDYHLNSWIDLHETGLNACKLPDVTMVGPELVNKEPDYSTVSAEYRDKIIEMGPFRTTESLLIPYMNLVLTPVGNFCSILIKENSDGIKEE